MSKSPRLPTEGIKRLRKHVVVPNKKIYNRNKFNSHDKKNLYYHIGKAITTENKEQSTKERKKS